ncbi:CIA30 family protein [Jannaschia sp. W003]|uniref:CIA30 family protein n=1 Tax=Jannaschia sp. W003 TaxID=2867012 RepID=UPI0021A26C50|nr:CIA30 family protein [Jannaschia sp. W003]UWQ22234.1 CIA30 family protein [Jannaschia sp. W003]
MLRALLLALLPLAAEADAMDLTPRWEFVADTVMGGVSTGAIAEGVVEGRDAVRLRGEVSLENDGGFVQVATDLDPVGPEWTGVAFETLGNGETYEVRLRTDALRRPWQSFRAPFRAPAAWATVRVPFAALEPHRTDARFDPAELRRLGIVAVGRAFAADVAVSNLRLYR